MEKKTSTTISFDIGIHNLGVCVATSSYEQKFNVDVNELFILDLINTKKVVVRDVIPAIKSVFDKEIQPLIKKYNPAFIALESQPQTNPTMKIVCMSIYMYFICCSDISNVRFISPKNKLYICPEIDEREDVIELQTKKLNGKGHSYRANKKLAIIYSLELLKDTKWINTIKDSKKKDDLCDAYLQAVYTLNEDYKIKTKKSKKRKRK
jgi:hypothetical protein